MKEVNKKLKKYIEENIFPSYKKNDKGHDLDHIQYVIDRSLIFASSLDDIDYDMVYTIAAYHDIGYYIDAKNHEKISAEMLLADENLRKFFTEDEIRIMSEAVYDHRASMDGDPRSIYGRIVSSADRETRVDIQLQRMYEYRLTHYPDKSLDWMIEDTRLYIINKFGKKGYATEKIYFEDLDYKRFLEELSTISENEDIFKNRFIEANNYNIDNNKAKTSIRTLNK